VEAIGLLSDYDWPGNVRELENIVERAINLTEGNTILSTHLIINKSKKSNLNANNEIKSLKDAVCDVEKKVLEEAIVYSNGDKKTAMNLLQISKTSFYEKVKKYNLDINNTQIRNNSLNRE